MSSYDVIVVGLGAVGSAATWHLARSGRKVLGLDQHTPPHPYGSSTGETRVTRAAIGEGSEYTPLALRSNELWREIETETGGTLLVQCGCLTITGHPNKSASRGVEEFFANILRSAKDFDIPHQVFHSADELRRRFPQFAVRDMEVGFLDEAGGYLFLEPCIRGQLHLAAKCGATLKYGEKVAAFAASRTEVSVTTRAGQSYAAEHVLLTAGAWVPGFLPPDLRRHFTITRQFLHWFEIRSHPERFIRDCPTFIWEVDRNSSLYGFPLVDGVEAGLKIANEESEGLVDPDDVNRDVTDEDKLKMYEAYVRPFVPDLGPHSLKTGVCLYTNLSGGRFLIDRHPEHERVIFASPCSGHGFKHSAAIGEALADRLTGRRPKVDLSPFGLFGLKPGPVHGRPAR